MPEPTTIGQLRRRVADMDIGDYIPCKYVALNGVVGTLSELGTVVGEEILVEGSKTPNGIFYFIKVATGILVSDRVVQHTISWDTLNSGNFIQGKRINFNENLAITASATASSNYSDSAGNSSASAINNGSLNTGGYKGRWNPVNGDKTPWVKLNLGSLKVVKVLRIFADSRSNTFDISFSDDDVEYQILSNITAPVGSGWIEVEVEPTVCRYLKIHGFPYDSSYGYNVAGIYQFEVYEEYKNFIMRSLTGGVAYVDEDNNKTLIQSTHVRGAWPINNEWDKHINNSEIGREVKSLDKSIWNCGNSYTWTQDSPINGTFTENTGLTQMASSSSRVARGNKSGTVQTEYKDYNVLASNYVSERIGFRPVIEYRE
ncbi:discoidin domain-containing protein [Viridibacillus arvi]|uniref:discoidin domain-containing protein n=1 Tax=Viridibacillus arvi TaxID=263475 RepID=UPI0006A98E33|nr:discoidin domain-containing protein [Viridibacillus arvi]